MHPPRPLPNLLLSARANSWRVRLCTVVGLLAVAACGPVQAAGSVCPETRQPYAPHTFLGFACRDRACAAHKAGFAWADRTGVSRTATCVELGLSAHSDRGFSEGCRAYVDDVVTAEQSGFEWARENEIVDPCLCSGAGPRFEAGCAAYVAGFGD